MKSEVLNGDFGYNGKFFGWFFEFCVVFCYDVYLNIFFCGIGGSVGNFWCDYNWRSYFVKD